MKKKIVLFISLLFIPFVSVYATGISVNPSNVTITKGNSQTVTVTITNLAALMDISSSNPSVATVSKAHLDLTSNGPGSTSGTFVINGVFEGSANITVKTADATDFTEGNDYNQTVTIKVTVNKQTTTTTTTTRPKENPTNPPRVEPIIEPTTRGTQATQPSTSEEPNQQIEEPTTEGTTEVTTIPMKDDNLNGIDDEIEFASLRIVGYPIEFDPKVNTYSINIGNANAIYIFASSLTEGATIDKTGEINVTGLDNIVLTIKYNDKTSNITININRDTIKQLSPKTDEEKTNKGSIYMATTEGVTIVLLIIGFIYKEQIMSMIKKNNVVTTSTTNNLNVLDDSNIKDPINFDNNN